jgi:hypothetical protein
MLVKSRTLEVRWAEDDDDDDGDDQVDGTFSQDKRWKVYRNR